MSQNFFLDKNDIFENIERVVANFERSYVKCIQDTILSKPFGDHKFYIQSFVKRVDDLCGIKKMYHYPRLTKPFPLPGHTLQKADPLNPDKLELLWTLPDEEGFELYKYGKLFADEFVFQCIRKYLTCPEEMCKPDADDLSSDEIKDIWQEKVKKQGL